MKIFPVHQIAEIDQYTIQNEPIDSIDLMERAAYTFYQRFIKLNPHGDVSVLVGPGNNGGDALALARMLLNDGREVFTYLICPLEKLSADAKINLEHLRGITNAIIHIEDEVQFDGIRESKCIIDGLFGSGLNRPLSGLIKKLVQYVNGLECLVFSIDMPSGLFGEDNVSNDSDAIIMADFTISFQFPKLAFLLPENEVYVGEWLVEKIGLHQKIIEDTATSFNYTSVAEAKALLKERSTFSHKGDFGHALLLAGNYGKIGAAVLASRACLKSGVGLLTTHVPRLAYSIIQTAVPEAMASIDRSDLLISEFPDLKPYSAIGVGPGIGLKPNTQSALKELLEVLNDQPIVLDADALNILAMHEDLWDLVPGNAILTPHPGEFDRLAGVSHSGFERLQKAIQFAKDMGITLVLKGAHTAVVSQKGKCYFNSTGNAGMATAGSGDALTGIIVALLAQGYPPLHAAQLGVYVHGLAADLLLVEQSEEGIIASDIIAKIGAAFRHLRR